MINISSDLGSIERNTIDRCQINGKYISGVSYRSSKCALNQVSKTLANELNSDGITVISLCPGWVQTDLGGQQAPQTAQSAISDMIKTIRNMKKEDSGKLVNFDGTILPY